MRTLRVSSAFRRDLRALVRRTPRHIDTLNAVVEALRSGESLAARHRDHALKGAWVPARECHIAPDLLLVYERTDDELLLARVGTHAELFGR